MKNKRKFLALIVFFVFAYLFFNMTKVDCFDVVFSDRYNTVFLGTKKITENIATAFDEATNKLWGVESTSGKITFYEIEKTGKKYPVFVVEEKYIVPISSFFVFNDMCLINIIHSGYKNSGLLVNLKNFSKKVIDLTKIKGMIHVGLDEHFLYLNKRKKDNYYVLYKYDLNSRQLSLVNTALHNCRVIPNKKLLIGIDDDLFIGVQCLFDTEFFLTDLRSDAVSLSSNFFDCYYIDSECLYYSVPQAGFKFFHPLRYFFGRFFSKGTFCPPCNWYRVNIHENKRYQLRTEKPFLEIKGSYSK